MRFLEYKGEKLPLKLGFYALKHFQKETQKNILELEKDLTMEDLESLFYHSYVNGCKAGEGYAVKFTREEAEGMMDELFIEFSELLPQLLEDLTTKKKPIPAKAKKAAKK